MKIAVIGAGSTYTPELVKGFLELHPGLALTELALMDIQPERLDVVGGLCRRMAARQGHPFRVALTTERPEAIRGSQFVITQLRVGYLAARRADEYLGRRHGLVGQETTGVGGMAKALRTIPVILDIAAEMDRLAPGAVLVNFTNPSGLITEALARYAPTTPAVGLCNSPITMKMEILRQMQAQTGQVIAPERAELVALGLNHLTWYTGIRVDGEDVWPWILAGYAQQLRAAPEPEWEPELIEQLQVIPNSYLQYYYNTASKVAEQENWPPSRAEQVMEIETGLLRQYADPALDEPPSDLMKRGGAWYSTLATRVIQSMANDLGETQIVNTRQGGAVPAYPADWVLELPCRIDASGVHPLPANPLPHACFGLLAAVKAYEVLTVEAAVHGDRKAAYEALQVHPLGPKTENVSAVLDDLLQTHRAYLPRFWRG